MDPMTLIGKPSLLNSFLSENKLSSLEKMELLVFSLSVGCRESIKELLKFGAFLESSKLSEVLISWEDDEIESDERMDLMSLLLDNTQYKPTLEDQINCGPHIRLRLKLLLEKQEPKKLEYLAKISFRTYLINLSNGKNIIQTIKSSKNWPQHFLENVYDI